MADYFELFRVSCLQNPQKHLFEKDLSREQFLRKVFGAERTFRHQGTEYHYVAVDTRNKDAILGKVGRVVVLDDNTGPEEKYKDKHTETHRAAVVLIDPSEHKDGQKIAFQVRVGKPLQLLARLIEAINESDSNAQYHLETQPIFDAQNFWHWAKQNEGEIVSLTFDLVAPNGLWSANTNLKDEMKALKNEIGSETVSTTFRSKDSIKTNSKRVKQAVEYAEGGSGRIAARTRKNKRYNSRARPRKVKLETDKSPKPEALLDRALSKIREIFGRD